MEDGLFLRGKEVMSTEEGREGTLDRQHGWGLPQGSDSAGQPGSLEEKFLIVKLKENSEPLGREKWRPLPDPGARGLTV